MGNEKAKKLEFLRASGGKIVTESGEPILLRGMGLGGWLLPEGYMWKLYRDCDRPRRIERLVEELAGPAYARDFWPRYRANYVGRADIEWIAEQGFNSVRLPLNARPLMDASGGVARLAPEIVARVDDLVAWCREAGLYAILDMHGAPGGQTGANIDDSERDLPELFLDGRNQDALAELWRLLAERYSDEAAVAGYDLLNEPLAPAHAQYAGLVMPLYARIIEAVRSVDARHMIILEGTRWATDWSIFDGPDGSLPDENCVLQFHKYWSAPDRESVSAYAMRAHELGLPAFMGEGGENNGDWYTGLFPMLEDLGVSWNFWSFKKMDCANSPLSIPRPEGWDEILAYASGGDFLGGGKGPGGAHRERPDAERARAAFDGFLDGMRFPSCARNMAVVHALNREPDIRVPAEWYIAGGDVAGYAVHSPRVPGAAIRMDDPVTILFADGHEGAPDYRKYGGEAQSEGDGLFVRLLAGELVRYRLRIRMPGPYRFRAACSGVLELAIDGVGVGALTGDLTDLPRDEDGARVILGAGSHVVEFRAVSRVVDFASWSAVADPPAKE